MNKRDAKFLAIPEDFVFTKSKILINKSELLKAINIGTESGEVGYALIPQSYDKKDKKYEDSVVTDITTWVKESQKNLEDELKRFYNDL